MATITAPQNYARTEAAGLRLAPKYKCPIISDNPAASSLANAITTGDPLGRISWLPPTIAEGVPIPYAIPSFVNIQP